MTESNIELQFMIWRKKSHTNQLPTRKSTSGAGKSIFVEISSNDDNQ